LPLKSTSYRREEKRKGILKRKGRNESVRYHSAILKVGEEEEKKEGSRKKKKTRDRAGRSI